MNALYLVIFALVMCSCGAVQPGGRGGLAVLGVLRAQRRQVTANTDEEETSGNARRRRQVSVVAGKSASSSPGPAETVALNAVDLFLCGLFATALGDFIMHPIDTIKVTQQGAKAASGIFKTARTIFADGGILGFYPGVIPYCTADGLSGAIKFVAFELSKIFVEARVPLAYHPLTQFVCAAGAMLACSIVLVPGEVVKTRLQTGMVSSVFQCIKQTLKQDGIGGLFAGYSATMLRDVPYTMLELGLYENIKSLIRKFQNRSELTQQEELAAAAFTGGFTGFITTPLDLVKTRLMLQSTTEGGQYKGVVDAFTSIYNAGGIKGLHVGAAARVSWLLPFTTIYLGIYEISKRRILQIKKASAAAAARER